MTLENTVGNLRFTWVEGAEHIEIYELVDGRPDTRIGFLEQEIEGSRVEFEDGSFREHCERFLAGASGARVMDYTGRYDIQRVSDERVVQEMRNLDYLTMVGIIEIVWGSVPDSLKAGDSEETEWKLSLGEGHQVLVRRVH